MELLPKTRVELRVRVRLGRTALKELLMDEESKDQLPSPSLPAFAPMHRTAMGAAFGVVLGGLLFLMTMALVIKGGHPVRLNLALLSQFFLGYTVTFPGAFVGLIWGFGVGFLLGWGLAVARKFIIWCWLVLMRSRAEVE
jgi:hypothetical protein